MAEWNPGIHEEPASNPKMWASCTGYGRNNKQVFIHDIPRHLTEAEVKATLGLPDDLIRRFHLRVHEDGRSKGLATAKLRRAEDYWDVTVRINGTDCPYVAISEFSWDISENEILEKFQEYTDGEITGIILSKNESIECTHGIVFFQNEKDAENASLNLYGVPNMGFKITGVGTKNLDSLPYLIQSGRKSKKQPAKRSTSTSTTGRTTTTTASNVATGRTTTASNVATGPTTITTASNVATGRTTTITASNVATGPTTITTASNVATGPTTITTASNVATGRTTTTASNVATGRTTTTASNVATRRTTTTASNVATQRTTTTTSNAATARTTTTSHTAHGRTTTTASNMAGRTTTTASNMATSQTTAATANMGAELITSLVKQLAIQPSHPQPPRPQPSQPSTMQSDSYYPQSVLDVAAAEMREEFAKTIFAPLMTRGGTTTMTLTPAVLANTDPFRLSRVEITDPRCVEVWGLPKYYGGDGLKHLLSPEYGVDRADIFYNADGTSQGRGCIWFYNHIQAKIAKELLSSTTFQPFHEAEED